MIVERDVIYTDGDGRPIAVRPDRDEFASDYEYLVAWHDYELKVRIAFSNALGKALCDEFGRIRREENRRARKEATR